ncbi:MAG: prepilin-type N-terminal cleavage/methylation domain-containing protein [Deltaproteobacteria bacterium]|nr:prepilin-type N-terminal cleavage/methylation domain-containing protein [Deltaproteobacteria bacterium]MBK8236525.1 prepilin-type N-terminal cleavage/methylation domain-containing protein [Deltaproteobacteria bacterium]MBK8717850.1 prepilin-type N-terminal cleavage/methylation domain-containing protein [Deltaproteobacteria bacterium]MBP7287787.1 prepilin-type N-terminal cleavage/methylation domain-containing protein [Nannocystaceae bacterium]
MPRTVRAPSPRQAGFTLIELMMVVVVLGVLAVVAIGAYSRYIRNAHKTEVVADLSNLTLRQKTLFAKNGHYASSTDCEGDGCTYPLATAIAVQRAPIRWNTTDAGYTSAGAADGAFFRGGGGDVHGFDALQFMPEGGDSWCGYATISGWGSTAGGDADTPTDLGSALITQEFPAATADQFAARDWFFSYALCDFDFDGVYWAFTTTHRNAAINMSTDATGVYQENE